MLYISKFSLKVKYNTNPIINYYRKVLYIKNDGLLFNSCKITYQVDLHDSSIVNCMFYKKLVIQNTNC